MNEYVSVAKIITIKATSRASVKIKDNYYTVEYGEERSLPADMPEGQIIEERNALWDDCNAEVDAQIHDIVSSFK